MTIHPNEYFHIYNQGNNRQRIFFEDRNYRFFLDKVRRFVVPTVDIIAYCLMPNHFHFLVKSNQSSCKIIKVGSIDVNAVANGFRCLQSTYAQAINKQFEWSGSLFRQKTKFKLLAEENYIINCLHYIHQNPIKAGLVKDMADWPYSSFNHHDGREASPICSMLAREIPFLALNHLTLQLDELAIAQLYE